MIATLIGARQASARAGAMMGRNVAALRSGPSYWMVLISGVGEPVLYLLSIGIGVGRLVGDIPVPGGARLPYAVFVAPAMLASAAMTGAMAETGYNYFYKLKHQKIYQAIIATPVRPFEIALAELVWATLRCLAYTVIFLCLMVGLGYTTPGRAAVAVPATLLASLAFGAAGMLIATLMRGWQDFDLLTTGQFVLFFFSGTFAPVQRYPEVVQVVVWLTPLAHAVALLREITTGRSALPPMAEHVAYLVVMTAGLLVLAAHRTRRVLCD
jgi:lipooligosaccharide transport system permease protein